MYDIDSPTWYIFAVFMHMEFANVFINVSGICQCFMLYGMQLINYVYRVAICFYTIRSTKAIEHMYTKKHELHKYAQ